MKKKVGACPLMTWIIQMSFYSQMFYFCLVDNDYGLPWNWTKNFNPIIILIFLYPAVVLLTSLRHRLFTQNNTLEYSLNIAYTFKAMIMSQQKQQQQNQFSRVSDCCLLSFFRTKVPLWRFFFINNSQHFLHFHAINTSFMNSYYVENKSATQKPTQRNIFEAMQKKYDIKYIRKLWLLEIVLRTFSSH